MEHEKSTPFVLRHLWDRRWALLLFAAMAGVFALVIALYNLPLTAVAYAALLSCAIGAGALAADTLRALRRHRQLEALRHSLPLSPEGLPQPADRVERDYQQLLTLLHQQRQQLALEATRAAADLEDYYTLWAHQIKVPLSALDLLVQTGSRDRQALSAELLRLEQYVEMALGYVRLESPGGDYVLRRAPLDSIVRRAVRRMARLFILKGVALEYEGCEAEVLTDEKWLGFVLEQLLSNAVKYTPAQGSVTISCEEGRLLVRDTGIGIAAEDLPRIGEKGFTGYNGRQEERSTGLGLYLCRRILSRLSHQMTITSALGEGTCVSITFPEAEFHLE